MDTRHSKAARAARRSTPRSPASSRRRTTRRRSPKSAPATRTEPAAEPLQDAIEVERGRLYEAETLLLCTLVAMENDDAERTDTPYFPVLIEMARTLVCTALRRLD